MKSYTFNEDTAEALEAAIVTGHWAEWTMALRLIRIERGEITTPTELKW